MALYRTAQEGLTNIQKYARAKHVALNVRFGEHLAQLTLHDDGQGFDPAALYETTPPDQQGFGLQGIRERVELVSGQMMLQSQPQKGTRVTVIVPKNPTELVTEDWLNLKVG